MRNVEILIAFEGGAWTTRVVTTDLSDLDLTDSQKLYDLISHWLEQRFKNKVIALVTLYHVDEN